MLNIVVVCCSCDVQRELGCWTTGQHAQFFSMDLVMVHNCRGQAISSWILTVDRGLFPNGSSKFGLTEAFWIHVFCSIRSMQQLPDVACQVVLSLLSIGVVNMCSTDKSMRHIAGSSLTLASPFLSLSW